MGIFDWLFGKKKDAATVENAPVRNKAGFVNAEKTNITKAVLESINRRYIAFDVETTGLSATADRIVELGAVVFEGGVIVDQFSSLVNPGMLISASASKVNHITNEMLSKAPTESQVYPSLVQFLGDALQENTVICAHNAKFDMDFLCQTLGRLGYNGSIRYVDTLSLSRKNLALENYKQDMVASHFGFVNKNAHRAVTDAEICGQILWELVKLEGKKVNKSEKKLEQAIESRMLSEEELDICAVIQDEILKRGGSTEWVRFYKNSNGYVDACTLYTFVKFKFATKGKYIIIPANVTTPTALPTEKCSVNEGGTNNVRLYFNHPFSIGFLGDYIFSEYRKMLGAMLEFFSRESYGKKEAEQNIASMTKLDDSEIPIILEHIRNKNYEALPGDIDTGRVIRREDVVVNAVHNRCPLSQIKNYNNFDKGYSAGFPFFTKAEELRKAGNIEEAITLYDKARAVGYNAPALYEAYGKAFRKLKDYDNEIVIVEEFMERNPDVKYGELEARREKAIELLYNIQQAEKKQKEKEAEKEALKEQKLREKEEKATKAKEVKEQSISEPTVNVGKGILQMDDEGNIIKEYESVSLASRETGVNPKSIRDAAKGIQKHAGGFAWRYRNSDVVE